MRRLIMSLVTAAALASGTAGVAAVTGTAAAAPAVAATTHIHPLTYYDG